jgi:hypothetical protein
MNESDMTSGTDKIGVRSMPERQISDVAGRTGRTERSIPEPREREVRETAAPPEQGMPQEIRVNLVNLEGSLKARLFDSNAALIKEIPIRDLTNEITSVPNVAMVILDGIITQRLVDIAESMKIQIIAGIRMGNVFRKPEGLQIFTKE